MTCSFFVFVEDEDEGDDHKRDGECPKGGIYWVHFSQAKAI